MAIRRAFTVQSAMLVALWAGIGGFVLLHAVLLLNTGNGQTRTLFQLTWFGGLAVAIAISIYWMLNGQEAPDY